MKTSEYLDAVKVRHSIESDYRLAKVLDVTHSSISGYRKGRTIMDNTTAARVAELLAMDPIQVIADCEIERAKRPEDRKFWMRYAAAVVVTVAGIGAGSAPSPAEAKPGAAVYYVKWRRWSEMIASMTGFRPPRLI